MISLGFGLSAGALARPSQVNKHTKPARRRTLMTTSISLDPGTAATSGAGPGLAGPGSASGAANNASA
jgi:hypothetical protein